MDRELKDIELLLESLSASQLKALKDELRISRNTPGNTLLRNTVRRLAEGRPALLASGLMKRLEREGRAGIEKLKIRLKNRILETLLKDACLRDPEGPGEMMDIVTVRVKKRLAQLHLCCYLQGGRAMEGRILGDIITAAKKYELYPELSECLNYRKYTLGFRAGRTAFEQLDRQVMSCERARALVTGAKDAYYRLMLNGEFTAWHESPRKKGIEAARKSIAAITLENKGIRSPVVSFYLKFMEFYFCMMLEDYRLAHIMCTDMMKIVKRNPSVYRAQRLGIINDHLFDIALWQADYRKAVAYARKARQYFPKGSTNYFVAIENEFYALFYSGSIRRAAALAAYLVRNSYLSDVPFRKSKYDYLYANVLFRMGRHREALDILRVKMVIMKDKGGWGAGLRLLCIQLHFEMRDADMLFPAVVSYCRFTDRLSRKEEAGGRARVIARILRRAAGDGFDLSKSHDKHIPDLVLLTSSQRGYRWEPRSAELIPFQEWFAGKAGIKLTPPPAKKERIEVIVVPARPEKVLAS